MTGHECKEYGYDRLYQAVLYQPHTVAQMIRDDPELLKSRNYSGETVMEWFAVENNLEIVELLQSCGGEYSDYALAEACCLGHVDMVYLFLRMGVVPDIARCRNMIRLGEVPRNVFVKLEQAFHRYGYNLTET